MGLFSTFTGRLSVRKYSQFAQHACSATNPSITALHTLTTRPMSRKYMCIQRGIPGSTCLVRARPLIAFARLWWYFFVFVTRHNIRLRKIWVNKWYTGANIQPVSANSASRGPDPNIWLVRPCRNGYETDQVHVPQMHESFTNFPLLIDGFVHNMSLGSNCEPQITRVS